MTDDNFWQEVRSHWVKNKSSSADVYVRSGEESNAIDFFAADYDATVAAMLNGGAPIIVNNADQIKEENTVNSEPDIVEYKQVVKKHDINLEEYEGYMDLHSLDGFLKAGKILYKSDMSDDMKESFTSILAKLPALEETVNKFKSFYEIDISQFTDIYIPNCYELILGFYSYEDVGVDKEILDRTKVEILSAIKTLDESLTDKINEICEFGSIQLRAAARAAEAVMNVNGFVSPEHRIN